MLFKALQISSASTGAVLGSPSFKNFFAKIKLENCLRQDVRAFLLSRSIAAPQNFGRIVGLRC
jgi:hypothetical protein